MKSSVKPVDNGELVVNEYSENNEQATNTKEKGVKEQGNNEDALLSENEAKEMLEDPMDVVPPNFKLWYIHRDANRIKNIIEDDKDGILYENEEDFCAWCQLPTSKVAPLFRLCENVVALEDLGSGFPLYFEYKKFIFIVFLVMSLVIGIVGIIFNYQANHGSEWNSNGQNNSIVSLTIGNFGALSSRYKDDKLIAEAYINFGVIIIVLVLGIILRRRQLRVVKYIDENNITPSDFTMLVSNLPLDKGKKEVAEYFKTVDPNLQLITINYWYNITGIIKRCREFDKYNKMKNYIEFYRKKKWKELNITPEEAAVKGINIDPSRTKTIFLWIKTKFPTYDEIIDKTKFLIEKVESMKKDLSETPKIERYIGKAFITCETQGQAITMLKTFQMLYSVRLFYFMKYKIFKCRTQNIDKRYFDGGRIIVEKAADPTDVYWENLSINIIQRLKKMIITYSILFLLLWIAFGIYYGLARLKIFIEDEAKNDTSNDSNSYKQWLVRIVSAISSLIVIIINFFLKISIRYLSSYEKHSTYTRYHLSVATKLMLSTFINSALLPLFINIEKNHWFNSSGLATTIFYNVISISFVSPLLDFFSISYILQRFKMWREERKGENWKLTQKQANDLFEGPSVDMAYKYANTGLLFLIVSFYTPMNPFLPMIGLVGIFFQYWIDKYLLLRRHSVPETMGSDMALFYGGLVSPGMVLYGIWNYVYLYELSSHTNDHGQYSCWFAILYFVLPIKTLLGWITDNVKRDERIKYSDAKFTFTEDYDRTNPMSANKARARYLQEIKDKKMKHASEEEKKKIDDELEKLKNKDGFDSIMKYTEESKGLEINSLAKVDIKPKASNENNKGQKRLADKFMGRLAFKKIKENGEQDQTANKGGLVRGVTKFWGAKNQDKKVFPAGSMKSDSDMEHNNSDIPLKQEEIKDL